MMNCCVNDRTCEKAGTLNAGMKRSFWPAWEKSATAGRIFTRPLGWSRTGADKMARLRIYRQNKRDILELVRYQKKELPLAAGTEEVIYSATQMLAAERRNRNRLGKLADMPVYSIPYPQIKKIAALKNHIWGL